MGKPDGLALAVDDQVDALVAGELDGDALVGVVGVRVRSVLVVGGSWPSGKRGCERSPLGRLRGLQLLLLRQPLLVLERRVGPRAFGFVAAVVLALALVFGF